MKEESSTASLFVVALPIGNANEISKRAIEVLDAVDFIVAEDTRKAGTLLSSLGISAKRIVSYFDHNEVQRVPEIIGRLKVGESAALISDAGTPLISDPGYRIVHACHENGIAVTPVAGPSSITAALSVSGLPTDRFIFEGFLPASGGKRRKRIAQALETESTSVILESTHRIAKLVAEIAEIAPKRTLVICRELTKTYEEILRGSAKELAIAIANRNGLKGEIVLLVDGIERAKKVKRNKYKPEEE